MTDDKTSKVKSIEVIILEKDPTYLSMWKRIFKKFPEINYCITNDSKYAMELIKDNDIDLLISEAVLTESDGYHIAEFTNKLHPSAEVLLTTGYDVDLRRFNLTKPNFHILYKPYSNIDAIQSFINKLIRHEDVCIDAEEDSFSENEDFPEITEWHL